jgi:AcrR family transcriptional regulator
MSQAEKVLKTALRLFDAHGYSATTIEDIKLQSEVSVGVIYHHFGSKEGIAGALYVQSLHDFQRGLAATLEASADAEGGVRAAVGHHLRWMEDNPAQSRFLLRRRETEVVELNRADVEELNRKLFEQLEAWYRPRVAAGEIADLPLPLLFSIWFGPTQEYARSTLDGAARRSPSAGELVLADAAWAALRPE